MVTVLHTKLFLVVEVPGPIDDIECCNSLIHWVFQHCSLKFVLQKSWRHPFGPRLFLTSLISIIMIWCISSKISTYVTEWGPAKVLLIGPALAKAGPGFYHGWRNLFQSGVVQVHVKKTIENFCGFNWQLWRHKHWNMTSVPIHHMQRR